MSNPRVKRPFAGNAADPAQRQITSFFTPRASGIETEAGLGSPALPASVQSNLLSVGMRVRKSVPEGYKTNHPSAFKLWTDNSVAPPPVRNATPRATSRELLPFCGINKVGGLDCQAEVREDDDIDDDVPALDEIPELTMSQESTDSTISSKSARKRSFSDEIIDPVQTWVDRTEDDVSPRSLTPGAWGNARAMAIPRSRAAKRAVLKEHIGQENMAVDEDFDEADFLVYGGAKEMDLTG